MSSETASIFGTICRGVLLLMLVTIHGEAKTIDRKYFHGMSPESEQVINREAVCPPACPSDCKDLQDDGYLVNGAYVIYLSTDANRPLLVYCDMTTSGGGWLVFQRRMDGQTDFYRNWTQYEDGFGQLVNEFWFGNYFLNLILAQKYYRLRVDIADFSGSTAYAEYTYFNIGPAVNKYDVGLNAYNGGTAGDSLWYVNNMQFSTFDRDNDSWDSDCAGTWASGAWWYANCGLANLNGVYNNNSASTSTTNVFWYSWKNNYSPLKFTEMKVRPM